MLVDHKPVDVEIDDDNTGIFHVFELRKEMNLIIAVFCRCLSFSSSEKGPL